jgi:hypothetical protein
MVDYHLIATLGLLEAAAERRESILRQIYEVNRETAGGAGAGGVTAIVVPGEGQRDPREVSHLVERLMLGGVDVYRAAAPFVVDGRPHAAGAFVIPMAQVFARYARDLLEPQIYPAARRGRGDPVEEPYDVSAWSLGMQLGVHVVPVHEAVPDSAALTRVMDKPAAAGLLAGTGARYTFDYLGPDTAIAINRLVRAGARVAFEGPSRVSAAGVDRATVAAAARRFGLTVAAGPIAAEPVRSRAVLRRMPRVAVYAPWTGGNADEGWTRWVLEQHEFDVTTIHNDDIGGLDGASLGARFDTVILPDQAPAEIINGYTGGTIRPEYRGGIGETGVAHLAAFVASGGTLVTLGAASSLAIDRLGVPVRDLRRTLRQDEHTAPGSILRLEIDPAHPLGYGVAPAAFGFYVNGPILGVVDTAAGSRASDVARYPDRDVLASGWLVGPDHMAGLAAVVSVDVRPGRIVLFGIRPQHRAQARATFPLLFNALYASAAEPGAGTPIE